MSDQEHLKLASLIQNRYRVMRLLGQGSMGEVLLVYDTHVDRSVAMKLIKIQQQITEEHLLRFIDEAKCQARLQHPGIISVYDIGRTQDGRIFFTMRAVQGLEFSQLIHNVHKTTATHGLWSVTEDGWSFRRLIQALKQCADAVGFAHKNGVVHRDLKPQNLMIGPHREPLVLDWGVAKILAFNSVDIHGEEDRKHHIQPMVKSPSQHTPDSSFDAIEEKTSPFSPEKSQGNFDMTCPTSDSPQIDSLNHLSSEGLASHHRLDPVITPTSRTTLDQFEATLISKSSSDLSDYSVFNSINSPESALPLWLKMPTRLDEINYNYELQSHSSWSQRLTYTQDGTVTGTPAYMSPEQAQGQSTQVNASTDVYALGCILYHMLCGVPPFRGTRLTDVLQRAKEGRFPRLVYAPSQPLPSLFAQASKAIHNELQVIETSAPEALIRICNKAMSYQQTDRYPNAQAFSDALDDWMNGVQQRQEALKMMADITPLRQRQNLLEHEAKDLNCKARIILKEIPSWEDEKEKWDAWSLEDRAQLLRSQIEELDFEIELKVQGALSLAGELPEIHLEAAKHYQATHQRLTQAHRVLEARRAIAHLEKHILMVPNAHPDKQEFLTYLRGNGRLELILPQNYTYQLYREQLENRRLIIGEALSPSLLDQNDLDESGIIISGDLSQGSYRCLIQSLTSLISYPILIQSGKVWSQRTPHSNLAFAPPPLVAPPTPLAPDECYVPAGWTLCGDLDAPRAVPPVKLWIDGFVVCKHPVTHRQYIEFLNDLYTRNDEERAREHAPQELGSSASERGSLLYTITDQGYTLPEHAHELGWSEDSPVVMVNWWDACAYAEWLAQRSQKPWRLLTEWEWEKAARGVDGRAYPWGNQIDPSWCCNRLSHQNTPGTTTIGAFKVDSSPYQVSGMAGNTADWCLTPHLDEPTLNDNDYAPSPSLSEALQSPLPARVAKGGAWDDGPAFCHCAVRHRGVTHYRRASLSFRIAYSL